MAAVISGLLGHWPRRCPAWVRYWLRRSGSGCTALPSLRNNNPSLSVGMRTTKASASTSAARSRARTSLGSSGSLDCKARHSTTPPRRSPRPRLIDQPLSTPKSAADPHVAPSPAARATSTCPVTLDPTAVSLPSLHSSRLCCDDQLIRPVLLDRLPGRTQQAWRSDLDVQQGELL
jgi:hypothetical protein